MTYDPTTYWRARGVTLERRLRHTPEGLVHRAAVRELLSGLAFETVLDVGCGFGQYGEVIRALRPQARYTGLDLSPDLLRSAARRMPEAEFVCADIRAWQAPRTYDLVLATSVLMHVPPPDIEAVIAKLRALAVRHLVTLDWEEPGPHPTGGYQFVHDYRCLLPGATRLGLPRAAIYHLRQTWPL